MCSRTRATTGQVLSALVEHRRYAEVDPSPGAVLEPPGIPCLAERAARPAPPFMPMATEAGDTSLSVKVIMTLRLALAN